MYKQYYIYILANKPKGVLYIGVTNNLKRKVYEHKNGLIAGFTKRYNVHMLVHYEVFREIEQAIWREKRLKKWKRAWKVRLIEETNMEWEDLYETLFD